VSFTDVDHLLFLASASPGIPKLQMRDIVVIDGGPNGSQIGSQSWEVISDEHDIHPSDVDGSDPDLPHDDEQCSSLISAAADGLADRVQQLIAAKADLELQDDWGMTAVSHAVENNHPHIVKLLADANAVLDYTDGNNVPLICAAESGFLPIVEVLLAARANVNIEDANGRTALWHAQNNGHEDIVEVLLAANASYGDCATVFASEMGTSEHVLPIPNRDDDVDDVDARAEMNLRAARSSLLYDAACENNVAVLKKLLSTKASLDWRNIDGYTPLIQAVVDKNMGAVLLLLEHRADVDMSDSDNRTALIHAAIKNDGAMLMTLLDASASVDHRDSWDMTALGYVGDSDVGYAELLISKKATMDIDVEVRINVGKKIITAAKTGDCEDTEALLMSEASPNIGECGKSALMIALIQGKMTVAHLLIDAKATIDPQQRIWQQALTMVVCQGSRFGVRALLNANVSPDSVDDTNTSAMAYAIKHSRFPEMTFLLQAKATVDPKDTAWNDILHRAAGENQYRLVRLLLSTNISPNVANEFNETPLQSAVSRDDFEMAHLLIAAKADVDPKHRYWGDALTRAAKLSSWRNTVFILEFKITPCVTDMHGKTALMYASEIGHVSIMRRLILAAVETDPATDRSDTGDE